MKGVITEQNLVIIYLIVWKFKSTRKGCLSGIFTPVAWIFKNFHNLAYFTTLKIVFSSAVKEQKKKEKKKKTRKSGEIDYKNTKIALIVFEML